MARYRFVFYVLILVAVYIAGALIGIPGIEKKSSTEVTRTADGNAGDGPPATVELPTAVTDNEVEEEIAEITVDDGHDTGDRDLLVGSEDAVNLDPSVDDFVADKADEAATAIAERDQSTPRELSPPDGSAQSEEEKTAVNDSLV